MWKSGWNLDKEWVKRNEKWLILLVLGLAILILYAPFGKKTSEDGSLAVRGRWAESGTGTNSGIEQGRQKWKFRREWFGCRNRSARHCIQAGHQPPLRASPGAADPGRFKEGGRRG